MTNLDLDVEELQDRLELCDKCCCFCICDNEIELPGGDDSEESD